MRNLFLIFIIQSIFLQCCFSQTDTSATKTNHKMIISISAGTAIPFGVFSKYENINNSYNYNGFNIAGGAAPGYFGKFEVNYLYFKNIGFTAMFYTSVNNGKDLNSQEMKKPFSDALGGGLASTSYINDTKKWISNGALLGFYIESVNKFILFDLKFCVGVQQLKSPEAYIFDNGFSWRFDLGPTGNYVTIETQPSMTSYNVVGNIGIDSRFNFSKKIKAKIGFDSFFSQAIFSGIQTYTTDINYTNGTKDHLESQNDVGFKKDILLFCINAGICYEFK